MTGLQKGTAAATLAALCLMSPLGRGAAGASPAPKPRDPVPFSLALRAPAPEPPTGRFDAAAVLAGIQWGKGEAGAPEVARGHKKKTGRAWIELGGFLAYSTLSYWHRAAFPEDWQYQLTLDDQIPRVFWFEGWKFDSNNFKVNWTHTPAGALYYQFLRTNNLSALESWLLTIAASTYWECVVEWKEVISLNDQITTALASYAMGEPWYQIGHFLAHQPDTFHKVLSFANPILKFNHWLDRKEPGEGYYVQPGWRDFRMFAGARRFETSGSEAETAAYVGFRTQLLGLPEYGKPGEVERAVKDTYFSEISLDFVLRDGHSDETRLRTKAVTMGLLHQKINEAGEGYCLVLGLGSAFEYYKKRPLASYDANPVPVKTGYEDLHLEEPRNFTDKLAIANLAGPVLDWTVFRSGLRLRTVVEAYLDFGLINAYALNEYSVSHEIMGLKTPVFYYGYYYGFGGTFAASTRLDWKNFRARGLASFSAWGSADFRDRFQDEITNNAHLSDNQTRCLLGVGWKVPRAPLELFADIEGFWRWGRLEDVRVHRLEKKAYAGLAFIF